MRLAVNRSSHCIRGAVHTRITLDAQLVSQPSHPAIGYPEGSFCFTEASDLATSD